MDSPAAPEHGAVITVSSNKGGVGKTTLATNLAIYTRALREDLPVLLVGLDDQGTIDRMFGLRAPSPVDGNLKHAWAERNPTRAAQLGQYGVHFVPSPPDVALLKARAGDPLTLARILRETAWPGLVILDTKSDLEALTINAYHAADRILVPIADWSSLEEAEKIFRLLEAEGRGAVARARVVFTLVDRRSRVGAGGPTLHRRLRDEVARRGWQAHRTALSRSPRVEMLHSGSSVPLSILHHARGTAVHGEFRELTLEVLGEVGLSEHLQLWGRDDDADAETEEHSAVRWGRPLERSAGEGVVARWRAPWRR
jgi:cellulose biosynthesis protein BcsQ